MPNLGVPELLIILVIVAMLFGVGKLPQVFGSIGKGIKEFRRESADVDATAASLHTAATAPQPPATTVTTVTTAPGAPVVTAVPSTELPVAQPAMPPAATIEQGK